MEDYRQQRLEQKREELQAIWHRTHNKLSSLRQSYVNEAAAQIKFQLNQEITQLAEELERYELELGKLEAELEPEAVQPDVEILVQKVRSQIYPRIKERCGTMRVLDMTQPIELAGDQGIYTDVNILEKITGSQRLGISELLQHSGFENFDRFGLSSRQERVAGVKAVLNHSKLMVLGKPGSGKTTFLKFLAMSCLEGGLLEDRVPIFVTLKEFAEAEQKPNLMQFVQQFVNRDDTQTVMGQIIRQGQGFLLLDGLDEVREEDSSRVIQQIQAFADRYPRNQFVITCRIAAKEYTFQNFTEVEVADFSTEQIATFVRKWFTCIDLQDAEKAITKFLGKVKENKRIKELASSPLLLTLLCLEFEESFDFPSSRADLYERGVKVLLSRWDASREIERDQVYKRLSLKRKEDLLSQIALKTFTEKNYFFKQRHIEADIAGYITNLPDAQADPEALLLDSGAVLKSIEAQHGLLVERARNIYSFSHLTFQEFFAARQIKEKSSVYEFQALVIHITEPQWQEVFRLTIEMLPNADELLLLMKAEVDQIVATNSKIQQFLTWVVQKVQAIKVAYKPAAIQAFYFALTRAQSRYFASDFDFFDPSFDLDFDLDLDLTRALTQAQFYTDTPTHNIFTLARDRSLTYALALAHILICEPGLASDPNLTRDLARELTLDLDQDSELQRKLKEVKVQLPDIFGDNLEAVRNWWRVNGKTWAEKLRTILIEHRNIGHDWQFNKAQNDLLKQYYDANLLLIQCLNSDCYVSRAVRQKIEDTLLLPIAKIQQRQSAL